MTALPDAKREALRFRIWQFCQPREWDVTIQDIAAALEEPLQRVNATVRYAGWDNRIRALYGRENPVGAPQGQIERFIVRDVLAGRVEAGTL